MVCLGMRFHVFPFFFTAYLESKLYVFLLYEIIVYYKILRSLERRIQDTHNI